MKEEWRAIGDAYEVSRLGRVRRTPSNPYYSRGGMLRPAIGSNGYRKTRIIIDGALLDRHVHDLVAEAFIGPKPTGMCVNHIDGNKLNNDASNLEYVTPARNSAHASELRLMATGERHGRHTMPHRTARGERTNTAKLLPSDVMAIRKRCERGESLTTIAQDYGVGKTTISAIKTRRNWRHV